MKKVKRRILASLMTLAMIFQMMPAVAFAAGSLWGGDVSSSLSIDGETGAYLIQSAADLAYLKEQTSISAGGTMRSATYQLMTDIDLDNKEWTPISSGYDFRGTFNGNGYTISNVNITTDSENSTGFFGILSGTIQDLNINNCTINMTINWSDCHVGGLVGYLQTGGTIVNCSVNNPSITASTSQTSPLFVGGLVGYVREGTITNCYTLGGSVTASADNVGTVGGLLGYSNATKFDNCYTTTTEFTKSSSDYAYTGALIGGRTSSVTTNCYFLQSDGLVGVGSLNSNYQTTGMGSFIESGVFQEQTSTNAVEGEQLYTALNKGVSGTYKYWTGDTYPTFTDACPVTLADSNVSLDTDELTVNTEYITVGSDTFVFPDKTVYVNAAATSDGKTLSGVTVTGSSTVEVTQDEDDSTVYTFTMPSSAVTVAATYAIPYSESNFQITLSQDSYTYTGSKFEPTVTVVYDSDDDGDFEADDTTLTEKTDYTVTYSNNKDVAAATDETNPPTATITFEGDYSGTATKTFTITQANGGGSVGTGDSYVEDGDDIVYGKTYTIQYTPTFMANDALMAGVSEVNSTPTVDTGKAALFYGDTQIGNAVEATTVDTPVELSFTVDADAFADYSVFDNSTETSKTADAFSIVWGGNDNVKGSTTSLELYLTKAAITITLDADQSKTYDNTNKFTGLDATISGELYSEDDISATLNGYTTDTKSDVGTYTLNTSAVTFSGEDKENYHYYSILQYVTGEVEIKAYDVTETVNHDDYASITQGNVEFTEPSDFKVDLDDDDTAETTVDGAITYSYDSISATNYDSFVEELNKINTFSNGDKIEVTYKFTPSSLNYSGTVTGTLGMTVITITFEGEENVIADAITYGDAISEIFDLSGLSANVDGTPVDGDFTLYVDDNAVGDTDILSAGEHEYKVTFTSTEDGYTNEVVIDTTKFTVAQRTVTYTVDDEGKLPYTGSAQVPTVTITNYVGTDSSTTTYLTADEKDAQTVVGTGYTAALSLTDSTGNYSLANDAKVTFAIVQSEATVTPSVDGETTFTYGDTIKLQATLAATGIASVSEVTASADTVVFTATNSVSGTEYTLGTVEEVASADGQVVSYTYDTTLKTIPVGTYTVKAYYGGGSNLAATDVAVDGASDATFTLNAKALTATVNNVDTSAQKVYDGTNAFTNVALSFTTDADDATTANTLVSNDVVTATVSGTSASENVAEASGFTATNESITLDGTDAAYYTLAYTDVSGTVAITNKPLSDSDIVIADIDDQVYTGSAITPEPTVTYGELTLTAGESSDFTYSYANNTNVAADNDTNPPTVTITAVSGGNYSGSTSATFSIVQSGSTVTPDVEDNTDNSTTFTYGDTITLKATIATAASLSAIGDDVDSKTVVFTATPTTGGTEVELGTVDYTGDAGTATLDYVTTTKTITPGEYTVKAYYGGGDNLKANVDGENTDTFTLNAKAVTAYVSDAITKTYDATKAATVSLSVLSGNLADSNDKLSVSAPDAVYADENVATGIAITFGDLTVEGDEADYYAVSAPSATGAITTRTLTAGIAGDNESKYTHDWSATEFVYDGTEKKPTVELYDETLEQVIPSSEYSVSYYGLDEEYDRTEDIINAGEKDAVIEDVDGGNYTFKASLAVSYYIVKSTTDFDSVDDDGESDMDVSDPTGADSSTSTDSDVEGEDYDPASGAYIYGETITITVTPTATGEKYEDAVVSSVSYDDATAGQMALFDGDDNQISKAEDADADGQYTLQYKTTDQLLDIGTHTVTAKFVGNDNMATYQETFEITIAKKYVIATVVSDAITKQYDGDTTLDQTITFTFDDLEDEDDVTVTADAAYNSENAQDDISILFTNKDVDGADAEFYHVALPDTYGDIDQADAVAIDDIELSQRYTVTTEQSMNIAGYMESDANMSKYTVTTTNETGMTVAVSIDENGELTYTLTGGTSADVGKTVTFTVTFESQNYAESTVDVVITILKKDTNSSYYIKVTATGNGTIDPDGGADSMYEVDKYDDVTFEFDPDSGYEVTDVIVNGSSVGALDEYEFENILQTIQTLEVVFEKKSSSSSSDDDDDDDDEDVKDDDDDEDADESEIPFVDIDEDDENYDGIAYVYDNGIMAGISGEVFGSGMSITRGMIAAILFRVNGSETVDADMLFGDVSADQYYAEAVRWGKETGVMAGISATEFAPDTAITTEQFVAFLYRYANYMGMDMTISAGCDLSDYADAAEISDYAYFAMLWAVDKGIIGDGDYLNPKAEALRGDVATGLMHFMEM